MTLYKKYKKLKIDFSQLSLEPGDTSGGYFCTPKGAEIIGWTGVDGIHCCFVKGFGEMVFAVNPSNLPGDYVHPLARSFEDFLRLILACGLDAAEQAWMWNRGEFDALPILLADVLQCEQTCLLTSRYSLSDSPALWQMPAVPLRMIVYSIHVVACRRKVLAVTEIIVRLWIHFRSHPSLFSRAAPIGDARFWVFLQPVRIPILETVPQ